MILRRFAKHVKDQNWFAVGLDVLVVIVGIFLGMQVTDWNEDRKDQARAGQIYDRLYRDLTEDTQGLQQRLVYWSKAADFGEHAIHYLETGDTGDRGNWETLLALYQASNLWRFSSSQTTFNEMMMSGDFVLMQDEKLREDLAEYYGNFNRRRTGLVYDMLPEYRFIIRGVLDYSLQRAIHQHCHSEEMFIQAMHDCAALVSEEQAAEILQAVRGRREVLESLRYWMSSLRIGIFQAGKDAETAAKLAARIKEGRP